MELFSRELDFSSVGTGARPVVLMLHGFYSSSTDWYSIVRRLGERCEARCYLVDLPNHGHSPHCDEFTLHGVRDSVLEWLDGLEEADLRGGVVIVGHSFGARVAFVLAERLAGRGLLRGYVMLDMSPFVNHRTDRMISIWHAMLLERMAGARRDGVEDIEAFLIEHKVDPLLAKGMVLPYRQMNLEVMARSVVPLSGELRDMETEEFWAGVGGERVLFLRGAQSPYMPDLAVNQLPNYFSNYEVCTIADGHHNLHHTHADELIGELERFYKSVLDE